MTSFDRVMTLTRCLGIDPESFEEFLEWALDEQLVHQLALDKGRVESYFSEKDGLAGPVRSKLTVQDKRF